MDTMIDLIIQWLGEPPNDMILNLYYVLAICIVLYFTKLVSSMIRSMLGIHSNNVR